MSFWSFPYYAQVEALIFYLGIRNSLTDRKAPSHSTVNSTATKQLCFPEHPSIACYVFFLQDCYRIHFSVMWSPASILLYKCWKRNTKTFPSNKKIHWLLQESEILTHLQLFFRIALWYFLWQGTHRTALFLLGGPNVNAFSLKLLSPSNTNKYQTTSKLEI